MGSKILISFLLGIFLISSISAGVIINQQPNSIYNTGDKIQIPIKITANSNLNEFLSVLLICNGISTEIHKEYFSMLTGEERQITAEVPIDLYMLGNNRTTGECSIKAILGAEYVLANAFKVSDVMNIKITSEKTQFKPEEQIAIQGTAIKENGQGSNGIIEMKMNLGNETINTFTESIKEGYFYFNFSMPKETKAGEYAVELNAYEKDISGKISNKAFSNLNIIIEQVPTSLDIVFEKKEIIPGTPLKVKAVLYDQTGEKIDSTAFITIKDNENIILEQREIKTDEFIEYLIKYNEKSSTWNIYALSNQLDAEEQFTIKENAQIDITIMNKTLLIKNIGNIPYNKSVKVKIGETEKSLFVSLDVNQEKKYTLTAPDGEYLVEILTSEGNKMTGLSILTGSVVGVREPKWYELMISHPLVWLFIILIVGFFSYSLFKRGYKRTILGRFTRSKSPEPESNSTVKSLADSIMPVINSVGNGKLIRSDRKAELTLSIKGEEQEVSVISLVIKNLREIESQKGNAKETIQKIGNTAEGYKAATYENNGNIYFIFSPAVTKTSKNEETAINASKEIKRILDEHNKVFKQKIRFGMGVNIGNIVAKLENPYLLKFMSLGDTLTQAKRMGVAANNELIVSEKMRGRMTSKLKVEKAGELQNAYRIQEIRDDNPENKSFLDRFKKRNE